MLICDDLKIKKFDLKTWDHLEFTFRSRRTKTGLKMLNFANIRQVILKQKRAIKCPFLKRFVSLAVKQGSKETIVPTDKIFEDYCQVVALWTDGDSLHGQTKYLMKKAAFYKVRQNNFQGNSTVLSPQNLNAFLLKKRLFLFLQQLKKELEQYAHSNNWDVRSAVKSGRI